MGGACVRGLRRNKIPVERINAGTCIADVTRSVLRRRTVSLSVLSGSETVKSAPSAAVKLAEVWKYRFFVAMQSIFFARSEGVCVEHAHRQQLRRISKVEFTPPAALTISASVPCRDDDVDVGRLKARNVQRVENVVTCSFCIHGIFNRNIYSGVFADAIENNLALRIIAVHENSVIGKNGGRVR